MYRRLRLRLTIWYVFLGTIIFVAVAAFGYVRCYESLNDNLERHAKELLSHTLLTVDESQPNSLKFKAPTLDTDLTINKPSVQLYDARGKLVSEFGPRRYPHMVQQDSLEIKGDRDNLHIQSVPLLKNGTMVGHLQIELSTQPRDQAVLSFLVTLLWIFPVVVSFLIAAGYIFSREASKPVEETFNLLRQFLADAGHELKTPVHLIQLTAENAMIGHESDADLQQDMQTIVRATDRMGRLIDDMMLLARMEVKQLKLKSVLIRIDELLEDTIAEYAHRARGKGIVLERRELNPAAVLGDPDALHRVIANLIENAIRYTDEAGKVCIYLEGSAKEIKIIVQDTGIGIPAESLALIFDRFYRVDKSRARVVGGTGLGLAIVKRICDLHKGRIAVRSEEGKGSTFVVSLPAVPVIASGCTTEGHDPTPAAPSATSD